MLLLIFYFYKMKYLNILFIFFLLFTIYLAEVTEDLSNSTDNSTDLNQIEVMGEYKKLREENNKKFNEKIKEFLKELNLEGSNIIKREQFKEIFYKLFEFGENEVRKEEEKEKKEEEKNLLSKKDYINKVFNNLVKEEKKEIEVDKIIDFFEPMNILYALKDSLDDKEMNNAVESLSQSILQALNKLVEDNKKKESEKNTDL